MSSYVKQHVRKSQEERREEILDATLKLISERGTAAVTVASIAGAVGLTPGALYRHFPSRAALLREANQMANQLTLDWVESLDATGAFGRLEQLGETHAAWSEKNRNTVVRPFFVEIASNSDAEVAEQMDLSAFLSFRAMVKTAEEGKLRGEIREDVEAADVAWALHMYFWTEDLAVMAGQDEASMAAIRRNLKRMLDSFRPEPQSKGGAEGSS